MISLNMESKETVIIEAMSLKSGYQGLWRLERSDRERLVFGYIDKVGEEE
jgi:hypothetical protein